MAILSYQLGKTATTTGGNVQIFGAPFNPYIPDGTITGITNTVANGGTFDLSGFQYGHEVVAARGLWSDTNPHHITFRKGSVEQFSYDSKDGAAGMLAYQGIDYDEIMSNGSDYYVDFGSFSSNSDEGYYNYTDAVSTLVQYWQSPTFYASLNIGDSVYMKFHDWDGSVLTFISASTHTVISKSGTNAYFDGSFPFPTPGHQLNSMSYKGRTVEGTLNYNVVNFPTVYEGTPGHIWVEGENICYVGAEKGSSGYKHVIKHDGNSYGTSSNYGALWIDSTDVNKLGYVSQGGTVRKTHAADYYGTQQGNETNISGATPGHIWVSGPTGNHGYLTFVGNDGHGYRIMNGPA